MNEQFEIKKINPEQVLELLKSFELPVSDIDSDSSVFFGVENESRIVGCIGFQELGEVGLLRSLAVDNRYQSKGLGQALTKKVIEEAGNRKKSTLYLLTTDAEHFFEKHGFRKIVKTESPEVVKKTKQYSEICADSAVVMKIDLAQ